MKRVIFPLVKEEGCNLIVYPDNIGLFSNTDIQESHIIADYAGELPLPLYTAPVVIDPNKQWSPGSFISLFSATEWDKATALASADIIAKQFLAVMYNSDFIQASDDRLLRGLDYFRYMGVTTRTNEEILA